MANPSYVQCIKHLSSGKEVWVERISDYDYDIYESVASFTEVWDNSEDYDDDKQGREFILK